MQQQQQFQQPQQYQQQQQIPQQQPFQGLGNGGQQAIAPNAHLAPANVQQIIQ